MARPIVVSGHPNGPGPLDVVVPPLAPFSVAERPAEAPETDEATITELWIRYDATRPMARDAGVVVVRAPGDDRVWRVELTATEALAAR